MEDSELEDHALSRPRFSALFCCFKSNSLDGTLSAWKQVLPPALWFFCLVYIAGLAASLSISVAAHAIGLPPTRWNPLSDPLMGDLMEYPGTFQLLHSATFFHNGPPRSLPVAMFSAFAYPPFASVLLAPFYIIAHPTWLFLSLALCWLAITFWFTRRSLVRAGLANLPATLLPLGFVLTSFPVQRLVYQGNIELFVWVFVATGAYAFVGERHEVAAGLWGVAAAVKLYPLLLLVLFAPKRHCRALLLGCAAFLFLSWLSLWWLGPTTAAAFRGSTRGVVDYQQLRTAEWSLRELVANHSAFTLMKLCAQTTHVPSSRLVLPYYLCAAAVFLSAFFVRLAHLPVTNQLLAVTVFMLVVPTVSYYHTLVQLYVPMFLLVLSAINAHRAGIKVAGLRATLLLFVPLCMPYTLFTFPHIFVFCGLVHLVALCLTFLCALQYSFPAPTLNLSFEET